VRRSDARDVRAHADPLFQVVISGGKSVPKIMRWLKHDGTRHSP